MNTEQSKQVASWFSKLPKPKVSSSNLSFDRIIFVSKHMCKIILALSLMHIYIPNRVVVTSEGKRGIEGVLKEKLALDLVFEFI